MGGFSCCTKCWVFLWYTIKLFRINNYLGFKKPFKIFSFVFNPRGLFGFLVLVLFS